MPPETVSRANAYHASMSQMPQVTPVQRTMGRIVLLIVVLALLVNVLAFSYLRPYSILRDLGTLAEAREAIHARYVDKVDDKALLDAALQGMAEALGDPNSEYFPAERLKAFEEFFAGSYSGIGAEVTVQDDRPMIIAPLDDSPAWRSGVMPGDVILEIDGKDTKGVDLFEAIKRIKGEAGTTVKLKVRHADGAVADLVITRETIERDSIRGFRRLPGNGFDYMLDPQQKIAYVRITEFGPKTAQDFEEKLESLKDRGMRALILDLRDNPGGLLDAAITISDFFLTEGQTIVTTEGRSDPKRVYQSSAATPFADLPIVVLVNENSASASEILAGAILDNGRGLVVGTRTYGKGSVQQVVDFSSGDAIKLTTAYWYVPSGRLIHRQTDATTWGVDPSPGSLVPMDAERDRAMRLKRRSIDLDDPFESLTKPITPVWVRQQLLDDQLAAALDAAQQRVASGQWPKVGIDAVEQPGEREMLLQRRQELEGLIEQLDEQIESLEPKSESEQPESLDDAP